MMNQNQSCSTEELERALLESNRLIRKQQDEAFFQSLKADKEKEKCRKRELEKKEEERRRAQDKEEEEEEKKREILRLKERLRETLPPEPTVDDPNTVRIILKLPNGTRLLRLFKKTDSIKFLHVFVFIHKAAPDNFQIVKNFPRTVLPCEKTEDDKVDPPTFEEIGLGKAELLFVQDNDA